jgi:3-hydroxyacyl-[acyl-carrier-protein] dehydratase
MWIDTIVEYEPEKRMVAVKNVSLAEEYLHDHFPADAAHGAQPIMPASLMIEGMAQTSGILVGAVNRFREKVILAKIARAELDADVGPGQTIRYEAELDRIDDKGASTSGLVSRLDHRRAGAEPRWEPIGRIDLMFSHVDRNVSGIEFPEENFVFSDNFRTILRSAGLHDLADV